MSKSQKDDIVKSYSCQFLIQASHHPRKLVSYLNLSISEKDFKYVYETTHDQMNVFCSYIEEEIKKKFSISVDCFLSKMKNLVHLYFEQPLISYSNFQDIIELITLQWEERKYFLENYTIIYPKVNASIKFKYDYIFFERKKQNGENNKRNIRLNIRKNIGQTQRTICTKVLLPKNNTIKIWMVLFNFEKKKRSIKLSCKK